MQIKAYDDIQSWKKSIEITKQIYLETSKAPFSKDRSLCDQMRRSAVSISSNIAEGFERNNNNEFVRYLTIAKGSAGELRTQIIISYQVGYLSKEKYDLFMQEIQNIMNLLGAFIAYLKKIKKSTQKLATHQPANP